MWLFKTFLVGLGLLLASVFFLILVIIGIPSTIILFLCTWIEYLSSSRKSVRRSGTEKVLIYLGSMWVGTLDSVGGFFRETAIFFDILANCLFGQVLEIMITSKRRTTLGTGRCTLSASIGLLEKYGHLNWFGVWISSTLNFLFNQRAHCLDAWDLYKLTKIFNRRIEKLR